MTFQFQCPQGHLLEGDPSHVGQQCQCPTCGSLFIIPAPLEQQPLPAEQPSQPFPGQQFPQQPAYPEAEVQPPFPAPADAAPGLPEVGPGRPAFDPTGSNQSQLYHIPCPNGHELEVPPEMLNQEVMCPHCNAQFLLRQKDSVEHKRRKKEEQERRDYKTGQTWFVWAIVIAIVVLSGLIAMIALNG